MKELMEKIWGYVIDVVFGSNTLTKEKDGLLDLPKATNEHPIFFSLFHYKNSKTKKLIWDIKYKGNKTLVRAVAEMLHEHILEDLGDIHLMIDFREPIMIPIPATKRRMKEHGFNQCERIVRELERIDINKSFETSYKILTKTKNTDSQAHTKNKSARLINLKNSFKVDFSEKIRGRNIILIDDVWTTGATLGEARGELLKAGARHVIAYTIAHLYS